MFKIGIISIFLSILLIALWYVRRFFNWLFRHIPFIKQQISLHRYLSNLIIGMSVLGILIYFQNFPFLMDQEDANLDLIMQWQDDIPPINEKGIPPFLFLDIDDQTHKLWGEPLFTPRHHIKELVDAAVKGGAKLVIVDINLSQKTPIEGLELPEKLARHPYDQQLYDYLAEYKTNHCQTDKACPPIIMARDVLSPLETSNGTGEFFQDILAIIREPLHSIPMPILEPRPSFLDSAVVQSTPYVQWASPLFWKSSYDGGIRRWWLWQAICKEKQADIIPSIELLAATMVRSEGAQQAKDSIDNALAKFKPRYCTDAYTLPWSSSEPLTIVNGLTVTDGVRGIRQRIMYHMPWRNPEKTTGTVRDAFEDEQGEEILTIVPAQPYLELSPNIQTQFAENRIVLIGGSYSEGGDMHVTSLIEDMPGGLIIINAIHSLLQYEGGIQPLSNWTKLAFVAGFIILVTLIFTFLKSVLSTIIIGIVTFLVAIFISLLSLKIGTWINFALPILAVEICEIMTKIEDWKEDCKKEDWKKASPDELFKVTEKYFNDVTMRFNELKKVTFPILSSQSQTMATTLTKLEIPPKTAISEKQEVKKPKDVI